MLAFIYVKASKQVGDPEHLTVFATAGGTAKWVEKTTLKAVAMFWNEQHCSQDNLRDARALGARNCLPAAGIACGPTIRKV